MKNTVRTRAAAVLAVAGMAVGIGVVASPAAQAVDDDIQTCRVKTSSGTVMASYKVTRYNGKLRDKVVIKPIYYKTNSNYTFRGLSALMMQHSRVGGNQWKGYYITRGVWNTITIESARGTNARGAEVHIRLDHKKLGSYADVKKTCKVFFY